MKAGVKDAIAELRKAVRRNDIEALKAAIEHAAQLSVRMGTAVYQAAPTDPSDGPTMSRGPAFISYVRENSAEVSGLQRRLEAAGVRVWRDTVDLWPGENWREKVRHAIIDDSFVFLACFSTKSVTRTKSYQNEELALAIEQMRLRRPGEIWLIPVRFDDCAIPDINFGPNLSLSSLHYSDLFGAGRETELDKLVTVVRRALADQHPLG
jgi:hypothetical protein